MISKTSHHYSMVTPANSSQLFEINGYMLPYGSFFLLSLAFTFNYTVARDFSHRVNVLFLIPWHGRSKEGVKQTISLQVAWNVATKGYITWAKKSSVKWKCEKEVVHLVHHYSVTGRKPRKNALLTYYKLTSFVSDFAIFSKVSSFSCYIFTSDLASIKNDALTFSIQLVLST